MKKRGNKGSRQQSATICEKEEGNHNQHQRVELKMPITAGKKRTGLEDPRAGICEASKQDAHQVSENEEMDLVERWAPSKMEKEIVHGVVARNVGTLTTWDNFSPSRKKEKGNG
jgi:hypothetical protein